MKCAHDGRLPDTIENDDWDFTPHCGSGRRLPPKLEQTLVMAVTARLAASAATGELGGTEGPPTVVPSTTPAH